DPQIDELALLFDRQLAREQEAGGLLGIDEGLQDAPAIARPLAAERRERDGARVADQLLLARRQALVRLRLVPAVGVFGEVAEVEHGEEAGRREQILLLANVDPQRRGCAQTAPRGRFREA